MPLSTTSHLPVTVASPSPPPPSPLPAPRAVRRLPLDGDSYAAESPSLSTGEHFAFPSSVDPLPPSNAGVVASSPGSPSIHCVQMQAECNKVVDWLAATSGSRHRHPCATQDEILSESDSSHSSYEVYQPKRSPQAKIFRDGRLLVHLDYGGRIPLCYYATGLEEGGPHDYYECFDQRDILWARQVRFHIERSRYS